MMEQILKVEKLNTRLRDGAFILNDISLNIRSGETYVLLGESGCGKSMTALSLMRLLPDGIVNSSGSAVLDGAALFDLAEREMRDVRGGKMAMIFQEPGLSMNPVMSVGGQIVEVLRAHRSMHGDVANKRCIELLDLVGIPDAKRRMSEYPFQLSGGMKQRVMIAMALAGNPRLLIADEPTTALDVTIQSQVLQLLRDTQANNGMSMLLITHDLGVVSEMAHQVGVMYAGQIVEQASRNQLFSKPLHPYTGKLFAALPDVTKRNHRLSAIPGSVPPLGSKINGCRFASRCDQAWTLCTTKAPEWIEVSDGQGVRCHLYDKSQPSGAAKNDGVLDQTVEIQEQAGNVLAAEPLESFLKVRDLRVYFPIRKGILQRVVGQVKAVDSISMEIPRGRTLALVGESGCGKTTFGKALLRIQPQTSGSMTIDGQHISRSFGGEDRSIVQMVFQDPYASLNPKMRVAEILEEGMTAMKIGQSNAERQLHIDDLLDQVGLTRESKWRYPHEFSGGQRQRIAIARALAVSPQLLICDEPTSALDVSVQAQILNLLKTLQQELGLAYLFITHNLSVVEYIAHEVSVMYLGRIVEHGTEEEVLRSPKHPYTQALMSAVPRIDGGGRERIRLKGDLPSPSNPPRGCHFSPRCPYVMERCRTSYPPVFEHSSTHSSRCYLYDEVSG